MSKMQKIAVVFLVIAAASGILHKTGVSYVPGLTALTLCVAMCAEGADMLKGTGKRKTPPAVWRPFWFWPSDCLTWWWAALRYIAMCWACEVTYGSRYHQGCRR